ncbi:PREDICTED: RNA-binding protein NOB1 [Dinoponera quadriceps]|uniref:RNA-binding protein NOB1 n=1 Tax=Dinoponera quadriceps TaxID=609295 RepID=A0A6P3WN40_DINQU|nr:PREDICTED: RNA-binding protein NOB1 [Dinoponera quadriceps]
MDEVNKVQYLIVDTSAFISNAALQDIGVNILTEQAVVDEIINKRQLRRLVVLPYDLKVQEAFTEDVKFVTEFSKKTGDYTSLSATDIKVIALTYQLEKEKVGTHHLKDIPTKRVIKSSTDKDNKDNLEPIGFYMPKKKEKTELSTNNEAGTSLHNIEETGVEENVQITDNSAVNNTKNLALNNLICSIEAQNLPALCTFNAYDSSLDELNYETASESEEWEAKGLSEKFAKLKWDPTDLKVEGENENKDLVDDILVQVDTIKSNHEQGNVELIEDQDYDGDDNDSDDDDDVDDEDDENEEDEDDDGGWITPGNFANIKKQMDSAVLEGKAATVACLTMDFAMQNVLMQMGLNVATLDGRLIKQMRTFIFRCYACFRTTSIMTKVFCPHCGNKTLKKVEVTLDENGKQQIHINFRRPLSTKGKKFSLPTPKGGKHSNNPILCEDQPMPDQRPTRLARIKNNPLEDDYIAGYSPFIMRDVNSKSAMLGIKPGGGGVKYWMKRNPNESRKKRK